VQHDAEASRTNCKRLVLGKSWPALKDIHTEALLSKVHCTQGTCHSISRQLITQQQQQQQPAAAAAADARCDDTVHTHYLWEQVDDIITCSTATP
jgi:hypothetical protein